MLTITEKYNWLLEQLEVTDVDLYEQDALVRLKHPLYFQFSPAGEYPTNNKTMDEIVCACLHADSWSKANGHG